MKYVFTVSVPSKRFIEITADFKIKIGNEIMDVVAIRSPVGHVIGYNATLTIDGDFKKACRVEDKIRLMGYQYAIRKV
ncbi:hypothetical protein phiAS5_ORF0224 [Aeromonas phage phiAS5]|uniref:Uncharacterized protein n=1 Tax=Aeromonas phage phiAS5 TaxID=879630 RepID=E1A1X8_9CAUD|nr:hypothetical protein phiAS5_ORF0224 [Aeromonas phage phiAS5]ADM80067.1 hypothetical protein phiAS5_ORF0224 [Aeromonas phage phiAS5]BES53167.1 hypothetical protein [Aeromonas phage phiWae14]